MSKDNESGVNPGKKNNEHDKRTQTIIGRWLRTILAMIQTCLRWKNETAAPVRITKITAKGDGNNPAYQISVRDVSTGLAGRGKAMLEGLAARLMNTGAAPAAEPEDDAAVPNPYMVAVYKILIRLKRLPRYKGMEIIKVDSTTVTVVMTGDKPVHLVFTKADLAKLRRMAVKSRDAKAVQGWAEYNLCLQLVAMQGLLPVAKQGGKTLVGVVAYSPKNAKFHQQTLIAAVHMDNKGNLIWSDGEKAYRAFSKGREVPLRNQQGSRQLPNQRRGRKSSKGLQVQGQGVQAPCQTW